VVLRLRGITTPMQANMNPTEEDKSETSDKRLEWATNTLQNTMIIHRQVFIIQKKVRK